MRATRITLAGTRALAVAFALCLLGVPATAAATSLTAGQGPVVGTPSVGLTELGQLGAKTVPLSVSWPAGNYDPPLKTFQVQYLLNDDGVWRSVSLAKPRARSVVVPVKPWNVVTFRVRAIDQTSAAGEWSQSAPQWVSAPQERDPLVTLSSSWSVVSKSSAFGGKRAVTTSSGDIASFTFTGRQIGWVARLGPSGGTANVSLDGGQPTPVNLSRTSSSSRRLVFTAAWPAQGTHSITVANTGNGLGVDVDAFVVLGDPMDGHIVGAGDIATCTNTHDSETAALVSAALADDPAATAFTAGDNVYPNGSAQNFANCYDPSWGVFKARTRPVLGNHEFLQDPGATGYFNYFGSSAGAAGLGWYRYESGTWRIYALTSECGPSTSCFTSQLSWLKSDLAAEPHRCVLAIWHRPLYSTGPHGSSPRMTQVFQALYDAGADVVVNGHDHGYQRFKPATATGNADAERGLREFVVGTGGAELYEWKTNHPLLDVRGNTSFGVLHLSLGAGAYSWLFESVPGSTGFTDSGTGSCH